MRGHQQYRCRGYGCHFTDTPVRGKPAAMKALAVLKWVRAEAASLPEPEVGAAVVTAEIDEMWHFLKRSLPSSGSGVPMTWIAGEPWPGCWLGVMMRLCNGSSTRSA